MADSVYRVTEVIGVSSDSWEAAAKAAVDTAAKTVRDLRVAEVVRQDVTIGDGGVVNFRVRLAISFKYDTATSRAVAAPPVHAGGAKLYEALRHLLGGDAEAGRRRIAAIATPSTARARRARCRPHSPPGRSDARDRQATPLTGGGATRSRLRRGLSGPRRLRSALDEFLATVRVHRRAGVLRAVDRLLRRHALPRHRGDLPQPAGLQRGRGAVAARPTRARGARDPARRRAQAAAVDGQPRPAGPHAAAAAGGARVHAAARGGDAAAHPGHRRRVARRRRCDASRSTWSARSRSRSRPRSCSASWACRSPTGRS